MRKISNCRMRSAGYPITAGMIAFGLQCFVGHAAAQSLAPAAHSPLIAVSPVATASPAAAPAIGASSAPAIVITKPIVTAPAATPAEKVAAAMAPAPAPQAAATATTPTTSSIPAPAAVSDGHLQTAALIAPVTHIDETAAGQRLFDQTRDDSRDDPISWSLHIYKSRHRTELYFRGRLFRVYHAVFGRSRWGGTKLWEGDSRTPEGAYLITEKRRSARFRWFLKLNYPNATDQERFAALRTAREISVGAREGGQVGIHGTDSPYLNVSDVNWTLGCVSVANEDIAEMARLLPVGTLVVINP